MTDSGMHAPAQSGESLSPGYPAKEALLRLPSQPPVRTNLDAPSTPAPGMPCPTRLRRKSPISPLLWVFGRRSRR